MKLAGLCIIFLLLISSLLLIINRISYAYEKRQLFLMFITAGVFPFLVIIIGRAENGESNTFFRLLTMPIFSAVQWISFCEGDGCKWVYLVVPFVASTIFVEIIFQLTTLYLSIDDSPDSTE